MGEMVLQLFAITQQAQMFFGPADMIVDGAPDPFVIGMGSDALAHYLGNHY